MTAFDSNVNTAILNRAHKLVRSYTSLQCLRSFHLVLQAGFFGFKARFGGPTTGDLCAYPCDRQRLKEIGGKICHAHVALKGHNIAFSN